MSEYDPFRPPQAPLLDTRLPPTFVGGDWARGQLRVLGALALGTLLGLLSLLLLNLWEALHPQAEPVAFLHQLGLLLALLWSYLALRLRALLGDRFGLCGLGWPLLLQALFGLLAVGLGALLEQRAVGPSAALELSCFAVFVALGLCLAWFALRLRRIRRAYPALRLLAWLLVFIGAGCASVVLLVPALLLGLAACAALAWVFFSAAAELPQ